jgi:hypothetical protein
MKGWLVALGIFAGLVILAAGLLWLNFYYIHVRYRLTIEVQDGDQIKTGSSVIDVSYNIEPDCCSPSHRNPFPTPVGNAPTVDLGERGMLFLTFVDAMRTPEQHRAYNEQVSCSFNNIGCLPFAAYGKPGEISNFRRKKAALNDLLRQSGPRDVPFAVLPKLVRFLDINDPHTLVPVSPNDLSASFGPSVQLKRVILELTNDAITPAPKIWPRWLREKGNIYEGILTWGIQNG